MFSKYITFCKWNRHETETTDKITFPEQFKIPFYFEKIFAWCSKRGWFARLSGPRWNHRTTGGIFAIHRCHFIPVWCAAIVKINQSGIFTIYARPMVQRWVPPGVTLQRTGREAEERDDRKDVKYIAIKGNWCSFWPDDVCHCNSFW